jgi:hypothetical protein
MRWTHLPERFSYYHLAWFQVRGLILKRAEFDRHGLVGGEGRENGIEPNSSFDVKLNFSPMESH